MMIEQRPLRLGRRGLHRDVVDALGLRIVRGDLRPGETIPNEADLSRELEVSRTVLREAIKVLASKGLVEVRPRTGTRVLPRTNWELIDPDVLHWQFVNGATEDLLREISEVRLAIEPAAAGLAAVKRDDEDLHELQLLLGAMTAALGDPARYVEADIRFHGAILHATHNLLLSKLAATVREALVASRLVTVNVAGGPRTAAPAHAAVVEAIDAGDRSAAFGAMEKLVNATWHDVETVLASPQPTSDGDPLATLALDGSYGRWGARATSRHSRE
jgi:DNA-binding FadR family transcriptional regulator